jgi:transposase
VEQKQAVGCARGGRNTKIHAIADAKGRLLAILLTGGEAHDCPVAGRLIRRVKPSKRMLGDKAYDSAELREQLGARGTKPVIPSRCNRKQPFSFNKRLYRLRWRIENALKRLKDFRRIATRYGAKLPRLCLPRRSPCLVGLRSRDPSTTLAEWFTLLSCADPSSAVRTSLKRHSRDEIDDGVPDGRQRRLRRRTVDSFFPASLS